MSFSQLHIHNNIGSKLDGVGSPEEYAEKAYSLGHSALACTDHGSLSALYDHQVACDKYGIKPIFGVEAYLTDRLEVYNEKKKRQRTKNYHLSILVKNEIGYKNLLKLNYLSMKDASHFYYVNRITLEELYNYNEGLIVTTGCMNSPINARVREDSSDAAEEIFKEMHSVFKDRMFAEVQLNEFSNSNSEAGEQEKVNSFIIEKAKKYNVPIIIAGDVHYLSPGGDQVQTLSIAIRNKQNIDEMNFEIESKNLYFHDISDYIDFNEKWNYGYNKQDIIEWCHNTEKVAEMCNYRIPEREKMYLPQMTEDDDSELIKQVKEGLKTFFKVEDFNDIPKEYKDRMKKETELIIRKGFSSYLLVFKDIFDFIDENGYYKGPARGSSGASLVCFALGITTLDPIKYNLIFERFLNNARTVDVVYDYFLEDE